LSLDMKNGHQLQQKCQQFVWTYRHVQIFCC
jgi:hypothetical protein